MTYIIAIYLHTYITQAGLHKEKHCLRGSSLDSFDPSVPFSHSFLLTSCCVWVLVFTFVNDGSQEQNVRSYV